MPGKMDKLRLDPLGKVKEAARSGKIGEDVKGLIEEKMPVLQSMIEEVEKVAGVRYPPYYVLPLLILVKSEVETGVFGVYYARNVPARSS